MDWEADEEELELDEVDEEYIDEEPIYTFYFHSFHKGVRVDQHVSYISVGRFTGKVRYFYLDVPSDEVISQLPSTTPVISVQEAKEIYRKYVQMELMFVREYAENGESIYSLAYTAAFPAHRWPCTSYRCYYWKSDVCGCRRCYVFWLGLKKRVLSFWGNSL